MRRLLLAAAIVSVGYAAPGAAAVIVNPDGSATITTDAADSFTVITTGTKGDAGTDLAGLKGSILFELIGGFNTNVLTFRYTLENISSLNNLGSSMAVFGFDVAPNATLKVLSGPFALGKKGNFSGLGNREFCLYDGSNCNGGGNDGLYVNTPTNASDPNKLLQAFGTFKLTYGNPAPTAITFSNFATRWQRVGINQQQSASGTGGAFVTAVPEPAQWAMLITGFGLVGGAMRARRRRELALA
jgi:hypothetical protein